MKLKIFFVAVLILLISQTGFSEEKAAATAAPSAYLPSATFTFEKVVEGKEILHDFIIENKGNAPLDITKVKPG